VAPQRVLVIGGGVGGLTAAHELALRGCAVTVLESRMVPGGKSRSIPVVGSGTDGRRDLPGEHGFRFLPGFYRHLPDTMSRIPVGTDGQHVVDNLVEAPQMELARDPGLPRVVLPTHLPESVDQLRQLQTAFMHSDWGLPRGDAAHFVKLLLTLLSSCEERRFAEYEHIPWWEFTGADVRSEPYRRYLVDGLTRTMVAAQAKEMSTRSCGYILLQLLLDMGKFHNKADRVLNGPTNDVWLNPWLLELKRLGVEYCLGRQVEAIVCESGAITHLVVRTGDSTTSEVADWYVAAVPAPVMASLADPQLCEADPGLAGIKDLLIRWMNGIMFYLHRDVPIVRGHTIYSGSPWGLTSISQAQFWKNVDMASMGDGTVRGILSVDVSDWESPGTNGKAAKDCTAEEIRNEVWRQLQERLNQPGDTVLADEDLAAWFLDTDISWGPTGAATNAEPMLINKVGSWDLRPPAKTAIANLFLASDYVQTFTDLACMEGANEAARRAVNGILDASASSEPRCDVWPLHEPAIFAPFREIDRLRFRNGHRHELVDNPSR
jgi:uncharacterized protein with NAD-binding domain and iron-sulfur cluster